MSLPRSFWPLVFCLSISVAAGSFIGSLAMEWNEPPTVDSRFLRMAPSTHSGAIVQVAEYEIRNVGTRPVILTNPRSSCGCAALQLDRRDIPGGASARLVAKLEPPDQGQRKVVISVDTNAPANPTLSWSVTIGESPRPPYVLYAPELIQFGIVRPGDTGHRQKFRLITVEPSEEPWIVGALADSDTLSVELKESTFRMRGDLYQRESFYEIDFRPTSPGKLAAQVHLHSLDQSAPVLSIPVKARVEK